MSLNFFVIKKFAGYSMLGFLPTIFFVIGSLYGLMIGVGCFFVGGLLGVILANMLIKNPFTDMLEGKGLLVLKIDSTGVIQPFILSLVQPFVRGKLGGEEVNDVYDRNAVYNLAPPLKAGEFREDGDNFSFSLSNDQFNKARFGMWQYPVLIYNAQIGSLITKDSLANMEKGSFAEHFILYLNKVAENLDRNIRDFGRYVVEHLKPQDGNFFTRNIFWIVIVVLIVILGILFAPTIMSAMKGAGGAALSGLNGAGAAVGG